MRCGISISFRLYFTGVRRILHRRRRGREWWCFWRRLWFLNGLNILRTTGRRFCHVLKIVLWRVAESDGNGSVNRSVVKNQPWPNAAFWFGWTQLKYDLFVFVFVEIYVYNNDYNLDFNNLYFKRWWANREVAFHNNLITLTWLIPGQPTYDSEESWYGGVRANICSSFKLMSWTLKKFKGN